jgi:hypothetical protein
VANARQVGHEVDGEHRHQQGRGEHAEETREEAEHAGADAPGQILGDVIERLVEPVLAAQLPEGPRALIHAGDVVGQVPRDIARLLHQRRNQQHQHQADEGQD